MTSDGRDRTPSERVDACVVGSGPAGALVARELAAAGHEVVVLEAGPWFDREDRLKRMERAIRPAFDGGDVWGMGGERDAYSSTGDRHYPLNRARVKGVGGSTLHWQGMVMRLHEDDFRRATVDGVGVDWPLSYDDLRPFYADAEAALGVAGASDNPFAPPREEPFPMPAFEPSYSDALFAEACERLGVATHTVPNARNSEPHDGRSACAGYGTCKPVCPSGAKYSADHTADAAVEAGARLIDRAPVQRLVPSRDGSTVEAAVYATPDGREHRQAARQFVVAAGGVETPRLLLLSADADRGHPDGLANGSGWVGRGFMDHLFVGAGGRLDEPTRQNHIGFLTSESHAFYDDPGRATEGADGGIPGSDADLGPFKLEFFNYAGPSPAIEAMNADDWGDGLLEDLRGSYGNNIAMGGLVEQIPDAENRVALDETTTDNLGNPVPDVRWSVGERTAEAIRAANGVQHDVLKAMDAEIGWTVGPPDTGPAYHHMCTTRMGHHDDETVVDARTKAHDLDNLYIASSSVFVTAGAMNPTLTIAALALRTADHIDEEL